ncbi:hypothetical protein RN001_011380 [Aquatica leii]|uniref:Uncharacterized protein n=1 Tax=Aquatica leii TaxID=1421715 RepID=A0AAN7P830_9COLE|nr:hypothetical protein RN001_011380 [Aquatica leii]
MSLPKFLAIVCVLVHVTLSSKLPESEIEVWKNLIAPYNDGCLIESILSSQNAEALLVDQQVRESKEAGDYLKCLYLKLGIMKPNGDVAVEVLLALAPNMTSETAEKCGKAASPGADLSKKSILLADCIIKSSL